VVAIRYGDLINDDQLTTVASVGSVLGPPGGDGWQIVSTLPAARLPAGVGQYAILVFGKVGGTLTPGPVAPLNGVLQVCLGSTAGTQHPSYVHTLSLRDALPGTDAMPFAFMALISTPVNDPLWGASWDNSTGFEFCLWARSFRNTDAATYAPSFKVSDVAWLWWDLGNIPAGDFLVQDLSTPTTLTNTLAGIFNSNQLPSGAAAQKWLTFMHVAYSPRSIAATTAAPSFRFGYTTAAGYGTFVPRVGSNELWGQLRQLPTGGAIFAGGLPAPTYQQACLWYESLPGAVYVPSLMAHDRNASAGAGTIVHRVRTCSIRLDHLYDVLARTDVEVGEITTWLAGGDVLTSRSITLERPASGLISEPICLATGIVQQQHRHAYDLALATNLRMLRPVPAQITQIDRGLQESTSVFAFATQGLAPSMPDLQYRTLWTSPVHGFPTAWAIRDVSIVQFHLVRDANVLPTDPPTAPAPILLVPGRESPDAASLELPPLAPNAETGEESGLEFAAIAGATGYRRRWPLFSRPRRVFTIAWAPITKDQSDELFAFLVANPAWQYVPLRGAAVAVLSLDPPDVVMDGGGLWSCRQRVAELIWTGA
jgi:hypothetical protein